MKKKLFAFVMATLMLCLPFALTSCNKDEESVVVDMSERKEIFLTLYTITGEDTTDEAIRRVEAAMNRILVDRYKTNIVLKCFKADSYQGALEELYEAFALKAEEDAAAEKAAEEEASRIEREEKNLTDEEKKAREAERRKQAETDKAAAAEEEAARMERVKNGEDFDEVFGPQLDIFYIPSPEQYEECVSMDLLLPLDGYLKVDYKALKTYLHPNLLANATVTYAADNEEGAQLYALPNNVAVAGEGWYYVFDTELANQYGYDLTDEKPTLTNIETYLAALQADISAGTLTDVIAYNNISDGEVAPVPGVDFYGDMAGFPISATNPEYGEFSAYASSDTYTSSVVQGHFEMMAKFREAGYFGAEGAEGRIAVDVRRGSIDEVAAWKEAGYTVVTYRRPTTETELCRSGFYGISSYCTEDYQDRAMEVLMELYTNTELHNLFAFGEEEIDYTVNDDGVSVTRVLGEYDMPAEVTGNQILGYLPMGTTMEERSALLSINRASKLSAFASFFLV